VITQPSILIAGIGNIFLGDDAFGCEVVKELLRTRWPPNVRVEDFGTRGFDLAYAVLDGYDVTIFVDATARGETAGTLYTIEPDVSELEALGVGVLETHSINPLSVLQMVKTMGGSFKKILLVGCEPATLGGDEGGMGLSQEVQAAVPSAAKLVASLVNKQMEECLKKTA
jgi:hydrogenase maturation protease